MKYFKITFFPKKTKMKNTKNKKKKEKEREKEKKISKINYISVGNIISKKS